MTEAEEALACHQIHKTLTAYNVAGDRFRLEELAAQFTEDGVLKFSGQVAHGRAEIIQKLSTGGRYKGESSKPGGGRGPITKVRHNLTTSQIQVNGDEATGRTYFIVMTNHGVDQQGVYVDRLRKTAEGWRIAEREVRIDWQADWADAQPTGA